MGAYLKFRRLRLTNWKNFSKVDIDIQERVFLVGPNAAGKSNILDVFRFLRDIVSSGGGFQEAVTRRGGVSAIRCLAARRNSDIEISVNIHEEGSKSTLWTYRLAFSQGSKTRRPEVRREGVTRNGEPILSRPNDEDRSDPDRLTQTFLEQVNVNHSFRDLARFFETIKYLHIVPQLVREPDRSVGRINDPYGGDFLEQLALTDDRARKTRLNRVVEILRIAVPQLEEVELWRDVRGTPHLRGKYQHWRPQGAWQTESQFSDGTLRLLGLLWIINEKGGPLLLEEPELSLHPEIVRLLPQMLARAQRRTNRQIMLSTHSPELLRDEGIGLDEVFLLIPEAEGTLVSAAGSHEDIRDLLEGGVPLADVVLPRTAPRHGDQLDFWAD